MEDVLDLYAQSGSEKEATHSEATHSEVRLVFDEKPFQLLEEKVTPLPMQTQKVLRQDYESGL